MSQNFALQDTLACSLLLYRWSFFITIIFELPWHFFLRAFTADLKFYFISSAFFLHEILCQVLLYHWASDVITAFSLGSRYLLYSSPSAYFFKIIADVAFAYVHRLPDWYISIVIHSWFVSWSGSPFGYIVWLRGETKSRVVSSLVALGETFMV